MSELAHNWLKLAPNKTRIIFLFISARWAKINRKLVLKSPIFVTFGANLTQFSPISETIDVRHWSFVCDNEGDEGSDLYKEATPYSTPSQPLAKLIDESAPQRNSPERDSDYIYDLGDVHDTTGQW